MHRVFADLRVGAPLLMKFESFNQSLAAPSNLNIGESILLPLFLATAFGIIVALLHLLAHRGRGNQRLWRTLILIAPLIAMATMAVGTNIAAAFTLFGTLAIVRFRTPIREPLDAVFVIFSVVIGLATGNQSFMVAVAGTLTVALTVVILLLVIRRGSEQAGRLRLVLTPIDSSEDVWAETLRSEGLAYSIESCEINRAQQTQSLYLNIENISPSRWPTVLNKLLTIPEVERASGGPKDD